jgi:hypothetical protein
LFLPKNRLSKIPAAAVVVKLAPEDICIEK